MDPLLRGLGATMPIPQPSRRLVVERLIARRHIENTLKKVGARSRLAAVRQLLETRA